jgi:hypothetical protein
MNLLIKEIKRTIISTKFIVHAIQEFGERDAYFLALRDLETKIYSQNFI